ncbi:hypothetical protein VIOR3934_07889 [Vibrio orientalis CIP 102891 = ATCC 33934]|nr:hypothetical protein VIOR3934_07889 [Vibrio orientalis CIP 102891 = ATCC 33934]
MSSVLKASVISALGLVGYNQYQATDNAQERSQSAHQRAEKVAQSAQFKDGKVISRLPSFPSEESMSSVMWKFFFDRGALKPSHTLPHQPVDIAALTQKSDVMRVTWLGHSSLFIDIDQTRVLVDPVFEYASPWVAKKLFSRNVEAPVTREQLPMPDVIVISHDHYDHLEESTIRYYANSNVQFFVPLAVGKHLEAWGVSPSQITEFDWWESATVNGVELIATPANHNSGRTGFDSNSTLWASWVVKGRNGSFFYSGDTAYDSHFKQIGDKYGPFDLAFIEVAANVKEGKGFPVENWGHMQAKHTMQAFKDLKAENLFPVHWSTYELFAHRWDEPMTDLIVEAEISGANLVTPMVGETLKMTDDLRTSYWWQEQDFKLANLPITLQN